MPRNTMTKMGARMGTVALAVASFFYAAGAKAQAGPGEPPAAPAPPPAPPAPVSPSEPSVVVPSSGAPPASAPPPVAEPPPQQPAAAAPGAVPPPVGPPPPGPPPGYSMDYERMPDRRRERDRRRDVVLDYSDGQPVPPGYTVVEQTRKGLIITGSILFGISYGISLAVAAGSEYSNEYGWLVVPVAGPVIASTQLDSCENDDFSCEDQGTERGFLMLDTLVQAAGATMFFVGLMVPKKVMVLQGEPQFSVSPMLSPSARGLQVVGHF